MKQLEDGAMVTLGGFGTLPLVMKPRTTQNPGYPGSTTYPARPTTIGMLAIVELDGDTLVWVSDVRGRWTEIQVRELLDDEDRAMKRFEPARVCTVRIFGSQCAPIIAPALHTFMLVDERLGRPILGIHNEIRPRGHMRDPRDRRILFSPAVEWHPEGYDPPWLADVA